MIEFVREKVIMANNKECKTLEEALKKESLDVNCLFYDSIESIVEECIEETLKNREPEPGWYLDEFSGGSDASGVIILGLPLNFERVLVALNFWNVEVQIESEAGFIQFFIGTFGISDTFRWKPNKPLEEQSEETIATIAKILGYVG